MTALLPQAISVLLGAVSSNLVSESEVPSALFNNRWSVSGAEVFL